VAPPRRRSPRARPRDRARGASRGDDLFDGIAAGVGLEAARELQELAERGAARGALVEQRERARNALGVEEHPLAAEVDERDLARGQLLELRGGEELVAHRDAPVELHERGEAEACDLRRVAPLSVQAHPHSRDLAVAGEEHRGARVAQERAPW
jgi:hypothetical protein